MNKLLCGNVESWISIIIAFKLSSHTQDSTTRFMFDSTCCQITKTIGYKIKTIGYKKFDG